MADVAGMRDEIKAVASLSQTANPSNSEPAAVAKKVAPRRIIRSQVPAEISDNPDLKAAIAALPANYNLEIPKTIWRIRQAKARCVALQFPEGLLLFATTISDILQHFAGVQRTLILADVTYGACCIEDFSAAAAGADFLVHYGHSCLVPLDHTAIPCLYVFVDITIDVPHLIASIRHNFPDPSSRLLLAGTIQFNTAVQAARSQLSSSYASLQLPQARPLSAGEVLGCTAPNMAEGSADALVFVSDGRFHLEAIMMANPWLPALRYDPYSRTLSREYYDHKGMRAVRRRAIETAAGAKSWGVVMGTLGHQGNPRTVQHMVQRIASRGLPCFTCLISELSPAKLAQFGDSVEAWVQVACPRLSIDWGEAFKQPVLTPFEAEVALGFVAPWWQAAAAATTAASAGGGGQEKPQVISAACCGTKDCYAQRGERGSGGCCMGDADAVECKLSGAAGGEEEDKIVGSYPMDYYAKDGGPWNSSYVSSQRIAAKSSSKE